MSKITTAIIAIAAFAVAAPAFAASTQAAKVIQKDGQTLYCVNEQNIGSRLPTRTCLTKEAWAERGAKVASAKNNAVLAANQQLANQN